MSDNGQKTPPVQLVALNPENGPYVQALRRTADVIEASGQAVADAIRDLARVVALNATERVDDITKVRVGDFVVEHGNAVLRQGQRLKEA